MKFEEILLIILVIGLFFVWAITIKLWSETIKDWEKSNKSYEELLKEATNGWQRSIDTMKKLAENIKK